MVIQQADIPAGSAAALAFAVQLVVPGTVERWQLKNWARIAGALSYSHVIEARTTKRAELRRRLKAVHKAAKALSEPLHAPDGLPHVDLFSALDQDDDEGGLDLSSLYRNLDLLQARTLAALAATENRSGGRDRVVFNPEGLNCPAQCAFLIQAAWAAYRNVEAKGSDPVATLAAEALWRASGGPDRAKSAIPEEDRDHLWRWREPFSQAAAYAVGNIQGVRSRVRWRAEFLRRVAET